MTKLKSESSLSAILAASMATFTKLTASMVIFATFAASLVNIAQLGTFPAAPSGILPAALPVAPSATLPGILPSAPSVALPAALYLPHKTRTHEAHCVARKTAVFLAPKPLPLPPPTRSPRVCGPHVDYTRIHA